MSETTERFETKIPAVQKEMIRRASKLSGVSMSDFVISAALSRAEKVIEKSHRWKLTQEQSGEFVKCLMSGNGPSDRLKAAAERYKAFELAR